MTSGVPWTEEIDGLCIVCGRVVRPGEVGSLREVTGWAQVGHHGRVGTTLDGVPSGRVKCGGCIGLPGEDKLPW